MLNLDAYFARIGYTGPRQASLDVLTAICRGHSSSIAFENIDSLLGRTPALEPAALHGKLVAQLRGGYCFEHNSLLRDVLKTLGMKVSSLSARVVWMMPQEAPLTPRTHMLLKVEVPDCEGISYIVDMGFGGQLLDAPLALTPGVEQPSHLNRMRITHADDSYVVETQLPQGWMPMYRFTLDEHEPVDYEPLNWFTASHPTSLFRHNLLIQKLGPHGRANLLNDRLVTMAKGEEPKVRRIEDASDFADVLHQVFGIRPPVPPSELFARIPKQMEGIFIPDSASP